MSAWLTIHDVIPKLSSWIMAPGSRPALYDIDFAVRLSSGPGGVYLHTYHRLRDVFFCQSRLKSCKNAVRDPRGLGYCCAIGCVGGVITCFLVV